MTIMQIYKVCPNVAGSICAFLRDVRFEHLEDDSIYLDQILCKGAALQSNLKAGRKRDDI